MQAGLDKVRLKTTVLRDADLPSDQVALVRDAIARHPLALIVEPADPTDTQMAEALQKASAAGIPVVLVNRPMSTKGSAAAAAKAGDPVGKGSGASSANAVSPGTPNTSSSGGARPLVLVTPPSFNPAARLLVASAIRNARNAKLDPKGGAVLLMNAIRRLLQPGAHRGHSHVSSRKTAWPPSRKSVSRSQPTSAQNS